MKYSLPVFFTLIVAGLGNGKLGELFTTPRATTLVLVVFFTVFILTYKILKTYANCNHPERGTRIGFFR